MKTKVVLIVLLFMLFAVGVKAEPKSDTDIITYEPTTKSFQRITVGSYETCIFMGDLFLEKYPDADYVCVEND